MTGRRRTEQAAGVMGLGLLALAVVAFTDLLQGRALLAVVDTVEVLFAAAGAAGCLLGARATRGRRRAGWLWMAGGCASWSLGQAVWTVYEVVLQRETPIPSLADLGFLGFPVGAIGALWLLPGGVRGGERRRRLLDGLTVVCAVALLSWSGPLGAVWRTGSGTALERAVSLAYPVSGVLLLTMTVLALAQSKGPRGPLLLLGVGATAMVLSDATFALLVAQDSYSTGGPVDVGWCTAFGLFGLAGLLAATRADAPADDAREEGPSLTALPYVPLALAVPVVLTRNVSVVEVALVTLLVGLVLWRQYVTVRDNAGLVHSLAERETQLRHQAFHDPLTGLANRALFTDRVAHALELRDRDPRPLGLAYVDLDGFKAVNDTLGHAAGDELLVRVAERLRGALRPSDTLARLGGDEFAVLTEHGTEPGTVAHALVESLRPPFTLRGSAVTISASVGVASLSATDPAPTPDAFLTWADVAMYAVKRSGKNDFRVHTPDLHLEEDDDRQLHAGLAVALQSRQVRAVYQPVVDLRTGTIRGVETLARWDRDGRPVPPEVFVRVAERTGLSRALTELVLDAACAQLASWSRQRGDAELSTAVNISPKELGDRDLPERVAAALSSHGLQPHQLVLEVTESGLLRDTEAAGEVLARLRAHGVRLALDDFGTGYSSLAQLLAFPMDSVKLDRLFVRDIDVDPARRRFLEGVLALTRHLGLPVVAEGVERPAQLTVLRDLGCSAAQGYLFARPAEGEVVTREVVYGSALLPQPTS